MTAITSVEANASRMLGMLPREDEVAGRKEGNVKEKEDEKMMPKL